MVDQPKKNAPGFRQEVRRTDQISDSPKGASAKSDQAGGHPRDTLGDQRPDHVSRDLEVLEKRVLGAVRGAVTDVLKESNQHPELPYIDMDFAATDGAAKNSRPPILDETSVPSQYSDGSDIYINPPKIEKEPRISLIKLGSTIMAGLITGLVIGVVFGIIPLPITNFSDAMKISNDNRVDGTVDGAVVGGPDSSQSFRPLTDNSTLSGERAKPKQAQRSHLGQSNPPIAAPSAIREIQSGIAKPSAQSVSKQSAQQKNITADEIPKTATATPNLLIEDSGATQLPRSPETGIKIRQPIKNTPESKDAAREILPTTLKKSAPVGQEIVLRIKGGTIEIMGRLKEYDDTKYVIALPDSRVLTLRADLYDCVSDNCNKISN